MDNKDTFKNKNIVFGITGSVAAYKTYDIVSFLTKNEAKVYCVLTKSAQEFVNIRTLELLSKNNVIIDMFPKNACKIDVEHVSLAAKNSLLVVAPATANIISKFAHGIADDFLTTFFLSNQAPVLIAPAMNTNMYNNPIIQKNMEILKNLGVNFVEPIVGHLACGKDGVGHLATRETIIEAIRTHIRPC